jgi:hypothetical protein
VELPPEDRADAVQEYRTASFVIASPIGRWRAFPSWDLYSQMGDQVNDPSSDHIVYDTLLVAALGRLDPVGSITFCEVPSMQLDLGHETVEDPIGDCMALGAFVIMQAQRFGCDTGAMVDTVRVAVEAASGTARATRPFWGGVREVEWFGSFLPLDIGGRGFYEVARVEVGESDPLKGQSDKGKALLYFESGLVFRFYLTNADTGPGDEEWRVIRSLEPMLSDSVASSVACDG